MSKTYKTMLADVIREYDARHEVDDDELAEETYRHRLRNKQKPPKHKQNQLVDD